MNIAAAIYAVVDHAKAAVFLVIHRDIRRVVHHVISGIPPLRAHPTGENAGPIIQETVLLGATSVGTVVHQRAPEILLRPVFKRF